MAFKFPSQNWQEPAGFQRSPDSAKCCICDTTYDIGFLAGTTNAAHLCHTHSKMTFPAINLIVFAKDTNSKVTFKEFMAGRWNSWDRDAVIPYMDNELLKYFTEHCLKNCSHIPVPASTYDDAIKLYAAELIKRL